MESTLKAGHNLWKLVFVHWKASLKDIIMASFPGWLWLLISVWTLKVKHLPSVISSNWCSFTWNQTNFLEWNEHLRQVITYNNWILLTVRLGNYTFISSNIFWLLPSSVASIYLYRRTLNIYFRKRWKTHIACYCIEW